jgi:hypothetical protein
MTTDRILSIAFGAVSVFSLFWAIVESARSRKLSQILSKITHGQIGTVAKIYQVNKDGWTNVRDAHTATSHLQDTQKKNEILKFLAQAIGYTESVKNMTSNLFNDFLTYQEAAFDTRTITHHEEESLELIQMERARQKLFAKNTAPSFSFLRQLFRWFRKSAT